MPRIAYIDKKFAKKTQIVIAQAIEIIDTYESQGYTLSLRQLFYQFVRRNWLPNEEKSYGRLSSVLTDARKAGYIDWDSMEDRHRSFTSWGHYDNPADAIWYVSRLYNIDMWENQDYYIEVWVEKDALVDILDKVCGKLDVPYFACKGYSSVSAMWEASQRIMKKKDVGKKPIIIYLGDHDPSGMDMSRDITMRLNEFAVEPFDRPSGFVEHWIDPEWMQFMEENHWPITVNRIALNMNQIRELNPPPNPAKVKDTRYQGYMELYGQNSWELDALEPQYIENLIREEVKKYTNQVQWEEDRERYSKDKQIMTGFSEHYEEVEQFIKRLNDDEEG